MKRKLASIQKIKAIEPIDGADRIELATILGWKVVVQKEAFKVGELCVYCEVDSIMPEDKFDKPEYAFLKSKNFHIKTARIRGKFSQGIAFPLSILADVHIEIYGQSNSGMSEVGYSAYMTMTEEELKDTRNNSHYFKEGTDVTDILGVKQYVFEMPENMKGKFKGPFPSFIQKTKEVHVQTVPDILTKYKGTICYVSEKVDGKSATYYQRDGIFGVCFRGIELEYDEDNVLWIVEDTHCIKDALGSKNIAIQGEIIGQGIQSNKYKVIAPQFFLFNVFDIDRAKFYKYTNFKKFANKHGLRTVPILDEKYELDDDISKLKELAIGTSKLYKTKREGIVIRPLIETEDAELNGRVSFRVIDPGFLVKHKE